MQTDGWPEVEEVKHPDMINEQDLLEAKTVILNWIKDLRAQPEVGSSNIYWFPVRLTLFFQTNEKFSHVLFTLIILQQSVWPGEPVAKVLEDLQSAWRWGRMPNLVTAMELVMWTLMVQRPDKVGVHVTIHGARSPLCVVCSS